MNVRRQNTVRTMMVVAVLIIAGFAATRVLAQQINGAPGAPSSTVTLDGKELPPPPPMPFGGVIKENAKDSTPWWPPRVVPPKGAPNILLIMTDDQGTAHHFVASRCTAYCDDRLVHREPSIFEHRPSAWRSSTVVFTR